MTASDRERGDGVGFPANEGPDQEALHERVEELACEDRGRDRRLLWWEALVVLLVAAVLTARGLWLT